MAEPFLPSGLPAPTVGSGYAPQGNIRSLGEGAFTRELSAGIGSLPLLQGALTLEQALLPRDPNFDPFAPEHIQGWEEFGPWFLDARSKAGMDLIKARITDLRERREVLSRDASLPGQLLVGLADPLSWAGLPVLKGVGLLRGARNSVMVNTPLFAAGEAVRAQVDPFSTPEERAENMWYGMIFAAGIGGAVGFATSGARVGRLANQFRREANALDARIRGEPEPVPTTVSPTPPQPRGGEVPTSVRAPAGMADVLAEDGGLGGGPMSTPEVEAAPPTDVTGIKPVLFGLERSARFTAWGRLVSLGSAALEDLGQRIAGDRSLIMKRNTAEGGFQATPESAELNAGIWRGAALEVIEKWTELYARYLTGNTGRELLGMNLVTTGAKLGDLGRRLRGKSRADGKLMFHEFMEAITSAHKADRLEHPDPFVMEGVGVLRRYFEKAEAEGVATGAIRSRAALQKLYQRKTDNRQRWLRTAQELEAIPIRSANEEAALQVALRALEDNADELERLHKLNLRTEDELLEIIESIEEQGRQRAAKAGGKLTSLSESIERRRAEAMRKILSLERMEAERGLTPKALQYLTFLKQRWGLDEPEAATAATADRLPDLPEVASREQHWAVTRADADAFRDWFAAQPETPRLNGVLDWIISNSKVEGYRALARELRALNMEVGLVADEMDQLRPGNRAEAHTHPSHQFFGNILYQPGPEAVKPYVMLHEAMHFAVWRAIEEVPELGERAWGLLDKVRDAIARHADPNLLDLDAVSRGAFDDMQLTLQGSGSLGYGLTDAHELFSEVFVNPRFQMLLKRIGADGTVSDGKGPSLWTELVEFVQAAVNRMLEILGQPARTERSVYDEVMDLRGELYARNAEIRGETPSYLPQKAGERGARPVDEAGWTARQRELEAKLQEIQQRPLSERQQQYLDGLRRQLDGVPEWEGAKGEKFYLPHIWDVEAVMRDEEGPQLLRGKLLLHFLDQEAERQAAGKKPRTRDQIAQVVDTTIDRIITGETAGGVFDPDRITEILGSPRLRQREIDLPFEELAPFLERNAEVLLRNHAHRFGPTVELTRMFGERSAKDAVEDALIHAARHDLKGATVEDILGQVANARQDIRMLHGLSTGDAWMWNPSQTGRRRMIQNLQAYGTLTSLHGAGFSALVEVARPLMIHGVSRVFGQFLKGMGKDLSQMGRAEAHFRSLRSLIGEAGEVLMSSGVVHTWIGDGMQAPGRSLTGWQGVLDRRLGEPMRRFASGPYFLVDGLAQVTDLLKRQGMILGSHFLLEDVHLLAEGKLPETAREALASYGITKADAKRMAQLPVDQGEQLRLAVLEQWPEAERLKFARAVASIVRRTVVTAGTADIPSVAKGFLRNGREIPMLRLPFTFMNWAFAANNKLFLSGLQGRDRSPMAGVFALVGMGYVASWAKSDDNIWDNLPLGEKIMRAVDTSGVVGMWSDIPNLVETATMGTIGLRPALGLKPRGGQFSDILGELGGPGLQRPADIIEAFIREPQSGRERSGAIRRAIPLSSIPWWRGGFDAAERSASSAGAPRPPSRGGGSPSQPPLPGAVAP